LELDDLGVAVAQGGYEGLEVADDVDDVAAAVGQYPRGLGQLGQCLTEFVAVAG